MKRATLIFGLLAFAIVLFATGVAAAGVDLRKVILKPGQCVRIAKVSVCSAKAKPTTTVTTPAATVTTPAPPAVTTTVATPPVTVTVITTATPKVAFSDGTYRVGPDILAGTYREITASSSCYWARLSGFGGTFSEIIANGFGVSIVTIAPADAGFQSSDCGAWTKIG